MSWIPQSRWQSNTPPLRVQVVSLDWKWLFIYPDQGIAAVNQLVVPAGGPHSIPLTSASVMNSFFIPQLGSQIYTMSGMTTQLNLLADTPGNFPVFEQLQRRRFLGHAFRVQSGAAGDFEPGSRPCATRARPSMMPATPPWQNRA